MKNLVYLLVLVLAPIAPTIGKEIGPITLECRDKTSIQSKGSPDVLVAIDPKKNEVKVDDQTLRIATISEGFVTSLFGTTSIKRCIVGLLGRGMTT